MLTDKDTLYMQIVATNSLFCLSFDVVKMVKNNNMKPCFAINMLLQIYIVFFTIFNDHEWQNLYYVAVKVVQVN